MGIRETWNTIEAALVKRGFPLTDIDQVPQGRRCTIRVTEIPGDQERRGSVGSGMVRISWRLEIALTYDTGSDKRVERRVAEDAEDVIAAIYGLTSLVNHQFIGASIDRRSREGELVNTMRFSFQDQATL